MRVSRNVRQTVKNLSYTRRKRAKDDAYAEKKKQRAQQKAVDAQRQHELQLAKAKAGSKTASSTALATGATTLGLGLNAENNQDAQANRDFISEQISNIINSGNDKASGDIESDTSGLRTAVM